MTRFNFAILGAGGFIAPRHLEAIRSTGNELVAAYDPKDSVGILDRFAPDCAYFTEFEKFVEFVESVKSTPRAVQYISVCSPNYLHAAHIKFGLRAGAHVICEKPVVLNCQDLDDVMRLEREIGRRVYTVLQLRQHEAILQLKKRVEEDPRQKIYEVHLTYMTLRGPWYQESWKGDVAKSGGLSTNIGVHFFDMLTWIFGKVKEVSLLHRTSTEEKGILHLERARVQWHLSIDKKSLPQEILRQGKTVYRHIEIDGEQFEFSEGFTDLHNKIYSEILSGRGYGLAEARPAIALVEGIRQSGVV